MTIGSDNAFAHLVGNESGDAPERDPFDIFGGGTSPAASETVAPAFTPPVVREEEVNPAVEVDPLSETHPVSVENYVAPLVDMTLSPVVEGEGEFYEFINDCIKIAESVPLYGTREDGTERGFRFNAGAKEAIHATVEALLDHNSTEVLLVDPNDISIKEGGVIRDLQVEFVNERGRLDLEAYHNFINEIVFAQFTETKQRIGDGSADIEADFIAEIDEQDETTGEVVFAPARARVHCLCPPFTEAAVVTFAKKARVGYTLDRMIANGTLTPDMANLLVASVQAGLTIIFSGGTGSGKTTTLQALGQFFPQKERIALIEDRQEIILPKALRIIPVTFDRNAALGGFGSLAWAVNATTRMRIQRVIVGETIGSGFAEFCNVANSGVEGCMTTIHANDTRRAIDKMEKLYGGADSNRLSAVKDIARTVDIIVQQKLVNGKHVIVGIEEVSHAINDSGMVMTESLYVFDGKKHVHKGRLSDYIIGRLRDRGVPVDELQASTRPR
jgi:Flp pilus assembly CpaF family ATPase